MSGSNPALIWFFFVFPNIHLIHNFRLQLKALETKFKQKPDEELRPFVIWLKLVAGAAAHKSELNYRTCFIEKTKTEKE